LSEEQQDLQSGNNGSRGVNNDGQNLHYTYVEASTMLGIIQIKAVDLGCIIRIYHLGLLQEFNACKHANDHATMLFLYLHQATLHSLQVTGV